MSAPESIFRPREVNAPLNKIGGPSSSPTPAENPMPNALPEVSDLGQIVATDQELPIDTLKKARRGLWEQTGDIPSLAGGAPDQPARTQKQAPNEEADD